MKKIKDIYHNLPALLRNKYFLSFLFFIVWIFFLDTFDILTQIKMNKKLNQLQNQKEFYKSEIQQDSIQLHLLRNNLQEQEKFAREHFMMKKENEDIFIVKEKKSDE